MRAQHFVNQCNLEVNGVKGKHTVLSARTSHADRNYESDESDVL